MEPTVTGNEYQIFKYRVLSACYNVIDLGYKIGPYWRVECVDQLSWQSTGHDVSALSAYLMSVQPSPIALPYEFDHTEWDNAEVASICAASDLPELFISGVVMGSSDPSVPWRDLMDKFLNFNSELKDLNMPLNTVDNEENFRLGVKLGKFFASHFGYSGIS